MAISWDGATWTASTAYVVKARVVNGTGDGNVYICTASGTSAGSGGPTGTGSAIVDGTVTWSYLGPYTGRVLDVAPELASGSPVISASAQALFLAMAERLVADATLWGDLFDDGRRYLAGHFGELSRLRGRGPITSESVGPLSRAYATLQGEFAVDLTSCGKAYMDLVRTLPTTFGFTG